MRTSVVQLSDEVVSELRTQYMRLQDPQTATMVWNRLLKPTERKRLGGNLETAYLKQGGAKTVGMWSRAKGIGREQSIAELAFHLGFITQSTLDWLLREVGATGRKSMPRRTSKRPSQVPRWNKEAGELWFGDELVRTIGPKATRIVPVLDNFELQGWPLRIADPVSGPKDLQRLHATTRALNKGLRRLFFGGDGTGTGYVWRQR